MNNRAIKQWKKARISYEYLCSHISDKGKANRYELTLVDLVLVSNFKGGSATIAEEPEGLETKLRSYEKILCIIGKDFGEKELAKLNSQDLDRLISLAKKFCDLTEHSETKIDGFGPSFATALLNAYFPDLIPILDKRGLSGAGVQNVETTSQGQVKNIKSHYPDLIRYFHKRAGDGLMTLEEIDKEIFSMELKEEFKPRKKTRS